MAPFSCDSSNIECVVEADVFCPRSVRVEQQAYEHSSLKTYGSEGETEIEFTSSPEYALSLTQLLEQQEETIHMQLRDAAGPKQREAVYTAEQVELSVSVLRGRFI